MIDSKAIIFSNKDNVATLLSCNESSDFIEVLSYEKQISFKIPKISDLKQGFKIAVKNIKAGQNIIKIQSIIGTATENIIVGDIVHTHNMTGGWNK